MNTKHNMAAARVETPGKGKNRKFDLSKALKAIPHWYIPEDCEVKKEVENGEDPQETFTESIEYCLSREHRILATDIEGVRKCLCQQEGKGELTDLQNEDLMQSIVVACFLLADDRASTKYAQKQLTNLYPPDQKEVMKATVKEWIEDRSKSEANIFKELSALSLSQALSDLIEKICAHELGKRPLDKLSLMFIAIWDPTFLSKTYRYLTHQNTFCVVFLQLLPPHENSMEKNTTRVLTFRPRRQPLYWWPQTSRNRSIYTTQQIWVNSRRR
eukprot:gb/GECG01001293.1/.p1 GENE.gb/GECG01001293.1/~~gb/GECG01001293.1/.p1  ORF type:complete len:272 (+),score=32.11 gb/GECG01001293.1/:1-816(+)